MKLNRSLLEKGITNFNSGQDCRFKMILAVIELVEDIIRIGTYGGLMVYEFFSEPLEHFIYSLVPARACHHPLGLAS